MILILLLYTGANIMRSSKDGANEKIILDINRTLRC